MMIRVQTGPVGEVQAEAYLRSISSELEADTPLSRDLERAAGPGVAERLQAMGELPVGAAVITPGGDIRAGFLIHVVLQSAEEPVSPTSVRTALQNGLRRAGEWGLRSLALPPLGTGAGNLDPQESAEVMASVLVEFVAAGDPPPEITVVVGEGYEEEGFARAVELAQATASARDS